MYKHSLRYNIEVIFRITMADKQSVFTIRTRKFMTNRLLSRKQFVSLRKHLFSVWFSICVFLNFHFFLVWWCRSLMFYILERLTFPRFDILLYFLKCIFYDKCSYIYTYFTMVRCLNSIFIKNLLFWARLK